MCTQYLSLRKPEELGNVWRAWKRLPALGVNSPTSDIIKCVLRYSAWHDHDVGGLATYECANQGLAALTADEKQRTREAWGCGGGPHYLDSNPPPGGLDGWDGDSYAHERAYPKKQPGKADLKSAENNL